MRLNFRQGIVSHQPGGFLFVNGSGNVNLLSGNRPLTLSVADRGSNYTHSEDNIVTDAWSGPFSAGIDYWLFLDFDTLDFTRTFGTAIVEPVSQPTQPSDPDIGLIWYNTATDEQFEYNGAGFVKVFRVFVAKLRDGVFFSVSQNAPLFTGTQIGNTSSVRSGRILFTEFGDTLRRDDATFFTTEDQFFTNQSQIAAVRLEANVSRAKCADPALAAFQIVQFSGEGIITSATYDSAGTTVVGVLMENLSENEVGSVLAQGTVSNPNWDFSAYPVGTKMYADNGALTNVDPHVSNAVMYPAPQPPVARILDSSTVLFEQGLGGVGPKGPPGNVDNLPPATVSDIGVAAMSVPPATATFPVVVGDNDPRIAGGPFASLGHVHIGTEVSIVPAGTITTSNAQTAIVELDANKVARGGDAMTGSLLLASDPTTALEAATKNYVDGLVSGLIWLEPVCLTSLIADDINDPTSLTPNISDAYILSADGVNDWSAFGANEVVQWTGTAWESGGVNNATNFPLSRFLVSGTSSTPAGASSSFAGHDNEIALYDATGTLAGFQVPVNSNALFVCNSFSVNAFAQFVYDEPNDTWNQIAGASVTGDGTTITQVGNILSTKSFGDGGTVDAATLAGLPVATFSQVGHTQPGTSITLTSPFAGTDFGTPAIANDDNLVAGTVDVAVHELFDKKANKEPSYVTNADLPTAANVAGMIAEVLPGGTTPGLFVARGGAWVQITVNDGTPQNHDHQIPYDISFFIAGPAFSDEDS